MADFLVAQSASGDGSGSDTSNFMSVASFNSTASGGNTYYLTGTITTKIDCPAGTTGNPVTIRGDWAGFEGTVSVADGYAIQMTGGARSNYVIQNLTVVSGTTTQAAIFTNGSNYLITGCTITSGLVAVTFSNSRSADNITVTGCTLNGGNIPGGDAIRWEAVDGNIQITNLTITSNIINDSGRYGVYVSHELPDGCDSWAINDNVITNCLSNAGMRVNTNAVVGLITNVSINRNTITGNAGGMGIYGISGEIVDNISNANTGVTGGLDLFKSDGVVVEYNECSNNDATVGDPPNIDGNGILIDNGCTNMTVRNNECSNNAGSSEANSGVGIMALGGGTPTNNITIYDNYGTGNKHGFWFSGAGLTSIEVANNTFTACTDDGIDFNASVLSNQVTYYNNTLTGVGAGAGVAGDVGGNPQIHSNNCYFGFSTPYENATPGAGDVTSDPLLDSDGFPASNSPCVDAGITKISEYDYNTRPNVIEGDHIGGKWPLVGGSTVRR